MLFVPPMVMADIHKEAQVCEESGQICFLWWPKLPEIRGWHQDVESSYRYRFNAQVPDQYTFANAEAVMYANAEYQDASTEAQTLEAFIATSQQQFIDAVPYKVDVSKTGEFTSKGKQTFFSYAFLPEGEGNWEQVSYAEDYDHDGNKYYIIFVLSARSKEGYEKNIDAYNEFISQYQ
ncbi:hypothetical Protein YC6258_03404 [Gynuella sunshinyii YC6258]|uniref:PsbP C-terminal domain-containing protein n=2 Tax=Gynuella sunshinyii TaxID=1445505 RepID=A0A0C5V7N8_9GAMM|nr:hypothetical Protein YC6258_03404 [Gynuella sunshinyii YC6258]